jgi:putative hydrolase of the HAD superfamily
MGGAPVGDLKAVFFDVDDTLYSTSEFSQRARANAVDSMISRGLELPRETVLAELNEVITEFSSNFEHHFDKLLLRLPPSSHRGINPAVLVAAGVIGYHETKHNELVPFPDVTEALERFKVSGLKLGVITAGLAVKQAEKLLRLGIIHYFDPRAILISDQIGISKPNAKLYARALEAVGVAPAEALYVGDNPPNDVDPPNRLGMRTALIHRGGRHASSPSQTRPTYEANDLLELADMVLEKQSA